MQPAASARRGRAGGGPCPRRARHRHRRHRRELPMKGAARQRHLSGLLRSTRPGRGGPRARRRLTPHRGGLRKAGYVTVLVDDRLLADPGVPCPRRRVGLPQASVARRTSRRPGTMRHHTQRPRLARRSDRPRRAPWRGRRCGLGPSDGLLQVAAADLARRGDEAQHRNHRIGQRGERRPARRRRAR